MILRPIKWVGAHLSRLRSFGAVSRLLPHLPIAAIVFLAGALVLQRSFGSAPQNYEPGRLIADVSLRPGLLPPLLIGAGLLTNAFGLLFRSRIAWLMAAIFLLCGLANVYFLAEIDGVSNSILLVGLVLLFLFRRSFDRTSLAAGTLFALASMVLALAYSTFGAFYLEADFKPQIADLITALYYSVVTMSTVGYGDFTPQTAEAKLFTISIIVVGIVIFATSLSVVFGPLASSSLNKIIQRKRKTMKRENHYVVIGDTPLAINVWREMTQRNRPVTRIVRRPLSETESATTDVVVGDPSNVDILREAGADKAEAVLAMLDDDGENAFVILALRELGGSASSIAAINDAANERRIMLVQPDMTIAPQVVGGELLAMVLAGETVNSDFVLKRVLRRRIPKDM